jgi:hypothetical protein
MKNPIKSYFCFFSTSPFIFSLVLFVSYPIGSIIASFFGGGDILDELLKVHLVIASAIIIFNLVLVYIIRNKYITTNERAGRDTLFSVLVTEDGQKIIVDKPIWKKGKQYFINAQSDYTDNGGASTQISLEVGGNFEHTRVRSRTYVKLTFNKEFDKLELFEALIKEQPNNEYLCLGEYIFHIFEVSNKSAKLQIDNLVREYVESKISNVEFTHSVYDLLTFPEKLFSNVSDTKINLDGPKIKR